MGNKHGNGVPPSPIKFTMDLTNQKITLIKQYQMYLTIGELQVFPHGLDGLKLWQAGIVLSRYIIINCQKFKNKEVLELGSGVGISGICMRKWTQCQSVIMSDYHESVIDNIQRNCVKNNQMNLKTILFDWKIRDKFNQQFDIIMGSDLVYFGCPVKDLYEVFKKYLRKDGEVILVIPNREHYAQILLKQIENEVFQYYSEQLKDSRYGEPVLDDEEKSRNLYPMLNNTKFYVYHLVKKNEKK